MTLPELMNDLDRLGVRLRNIDGQLEVDAPVDVLTTKHRDALRTYKPVLVAAVQRSTRDASPTAPNGPAAVGDVAGRMLTVADKLAAFAWLCSPHDASSPELALAKTVLEPRTPLEARGSASDQLADHCEEFRALRAEALATVRVACDQSEASARSGGASCQPTVCPKSGEDPGQRHTPTTGTKEVRMGPQRYPVGRKAAAPGQKDNSTDTPALVDDLGTTVKAPVPLDTATLVGARFHRVVMLTNGVFVAEFFPQDLESPRIILDEPELYAAAIFAPTLSEELTRAVAAIERMRRRVARR
jgi:hypothetical protein